MYFLWIGMCIVVFDGVYVEYFCGICNLVVVKIGLLVMFEQFLLLMDVFNLDDEFGWFMLIYCMGNVVIVDKLLLLLQVVKCEGCCVLWVVDFMYGNIESIFNGYKMCCFDNICGELDQVFDIYVVVGMWLGGVYLEFIGEDVIECFGGVCDLVEFDFDCVYKFIVDL